jgi:hypothetical protein
VNAAKAWQAAPDKSTRKQLYKKNGVRWSELLRLSYWDPTRFAIIDGMHTLFLGLVRHHFREVIGTDWKELPDEDETQAKAISEKELRKGRRVLEEYPTNAKLQRLTIPVLRTLCMEYNVLHQVVVDGKQAKKKRYIEALQARK